MITKFIPASADRPATIHLEPDTEYDHHLIDRLDDAGLLFACGRHGRTGRWLFGEVAIGTVERDLAA